MSSTTSRTTITALEGQPTIDITREFDAPRDLVFRAHTDPELLKQWLGPRGYEMTVDEFEPHHGGAYAYTHTNPEGLSFGFRGVFHGEPSPDLILQTFEYLGAPGDVSFDRLVLIERDGRTLLQGHSVFTTVEARDAIIANGMEHGVVEGYERLDEIIAGLPA